MSKKNMGIFLVISVTLSVYLPSLFYHFVGDDYMFLEKMAISPSIKDAFMMGSGGLFGGYFRPLLWMPYLLGYALVGLPSPPDAQWQSGAFLPAYHILSVLFHLANVYLVYLISTFVFKSRLRATFSALLFALHPVSAEVVCWVAAFADVSFSLFSLLSIIFFFKFLRSNGKNIARINYLTALLSFSLALLSKESALCLPVIIVLMVLFLNKSRSVIVRGRKELIVSIAGYLMVVLSYLVIRRFILPLGLPVGLILRRLQYAPVRGAYYLRDLIFPADIYWLKELVFRYSVYHAFIIAMLLIGLLLLYIFISKHRKSPVLLFSLSWVLTALILPLILPFAPARRYLYFALIGGSIFAVESAFSIRRKGIAVFLLSLCIVLESGVTLGRNYLFKLSGQVVQKFLSEVKLKFPVLDKNSIVYLAGIPGTVDNISSLYAAPEGKIRFLYKDKDLKVYCLSYVTFTAKSIKNLDNEFPDDYTLSQSMETNVREFIRPIGGSGNEQEGEWNVNSWYEDYSYGYQVSKIDRFGEAEKVKFRFNPQFHKGKKVYFIGFKDRAAAALRIQDFRGKGV